MATIYDIAKEAGVSKSTVSRVINNQAGVNKDKKQKVLDAIKKYNYKPNAAARKLGLKRNDTIGVLVHDLSDSYFSEYVRQINSIFTNELHYGALYCTTNKATPSKVNYLEQLNKSVDGYIFLGEDVVSKQELKVLSNDKELFVGIGTNLTFEEGIMVDINNYNASYQVVEYLINLGHTEILYICQKEKRIEFSERYMGYQKALMDYKLQCQSYYEIGFEIEEAYEIAKIVKKEIEENGVTSVVCFNDIAASGLIDGLMDLGFKIPEDVSVVGFDDSKDLMETKNQIPLLTTIRQPNKEMAEYGVNELYKMIVDGKKGESKEFECELIIRETTAEPKKE
ncbi:LacI family DNA-binding transcriptional regulator [Clostridiaceae bacterium HSG29]|nr:LacI family DNA-binding transcriptional regulator [Clostridiaceae bacterium HSG29]